MHAPIRSDDALEQALRDLGAHVAFPPTPDLASAVSRRIADQSQGGWRGLVARWPATGLAGWAPAGLAVRRSVVLAILALLLLVGAAIGLGLGLRGLRIIPVSTLPPTSTPSVVPGGGLGSGLGLGEMSTLETARSAVPFAIRLPTTRGFGTPDAVYVGREPGGARVELVYRERAGLPGAGSSGVGLLVTQFRGQTNETLMEKMLGPGTQLELVQVDGLRGYWISGRPHVLLYRRPGSGDIDEVASRLVGNALIWERDGVVYRIEGALARADAIRIAESLR